MKNTIKTPLAIAIGSTLISGLALTPAQAESTLDIDSNPFSMSDLTSGYMQTAQSDDSGSSKMKDGSCGEGKCGSSMQKGAEEKTAEGKCAGNKPMPKMNESDKNMEGKCGSSM